MKNNVAAYVSTLNEGPYLEALLRWLCKRVDKVYVMESASAWAKEQGEGFGNRTRDIVFKLHEEDEEMRESITLREVEGDQHVEPLVKETHERNSALRMIRSEGYEWVWWVDSDEFYTDFDADALWDWFEKRLDENPNIRGVRSSWYTYWRSIHWRICPPEPYKPNVIVRTDCEIKSSRHMTDESGFIEVPKEICMVRHYSWAKSPREIEKKLTTWGHAKEGDVLGWKSKIFDPWKPGEALSNFHPHVPAAYQRVERCYLPVPEAMENHPYNGVELIEGEPEDCQELEVCQEKGIKVVVLAHNRPKEVDALVGKLKGAFESVDVIDSGSDPDKKAESTTVSLENVYWTGAWNYILEKWSDCDAVWLIGDDIELLDDPMEYRKAIESAMPFGCWTPCIEGRAKHFMQASHYTDGNLRSVRNMEGMAMALSGDMMKLAKRLPEGSAGYGQDLWLCKRSRESGMRNIIDGSVKVFHPEEIRYDDSKWVKQMDDVFGKMYGADYRSTAFQYSDFFKDNLLEVQSEKPEPKPEPEQECHEPKEVVADSSARKLVVACVDNGWGLDDFEEIVRELPEFDAIMVRKGVSRFTTEYATVVESDKFEEVLESADVFLLPKVGYCNRKEYAKVLSTSIPVVVKAGQEGKDVKHEDDVLIYDSPAWAVKWVRDACNDTEIRNRLSHPSVTRLSSDKVQSSRKESNPLVSIITPTWKRDVSIIKRCLDCVSLQTEASWEHLVCSNGGKEEGVESIIDMRGDHRIKYSHVSVKGDNDFGNSARKEMIEKAKGKYIAFVDDDNLLLPQFIEKMVDAIEVAEKDFAVCDIVHFGPLAAETHMEPPVVLKGEPVKLRYIDPLQVLVKSEQMKEIGWDTETGYLSDGVTLEKLGKKFSHVKVHRVLGFHM